MNYNTWLETVPQEIRGDSLWKMEAYRLSLFLAALAWPDVTKLMRNKLTVDIAGQLYRAVGSIEANVSEGYSRGSGRDRARFYEYALGSARESRGWYYKGRHVLGEAVTEHRIQLITHIIRLLLTMVPDQRKAGPFLCEDAPEYRVDAPPGVEALQELSKLLQNAPVP